MVMPDPVQAMSTELAALAELALHALRVCWRKLFRKTAPAHLSRSLLMRVIAYRLQADAFGDLSREQVRQLDAIARGLRPRRAGPSDPVPPVPAPRGLKPGAVLVREHAGRVHRVTVLREGYAWQGTPTDRCRRSLAPSSAPRGRARASSACARLVPTPGVAS